MARTIGTDLSHETISKVTDAVLDEVKAWQARPLEELSPIIYLDAQISTLARSSTVTALRLAIDDDTWHRLHHDAINLHTTFARHLGRLIEQWAGS